ncbi:hypothetical protein TNCV_1419041 [Trichonephila clavipes]|nr:hypothetical protein TNCV_1419041 [Trichonephila clavipes]
MAPKAEIPLSKIPYHSSMRTLSLDKDLRAVGKKCDSSENYELNTRLVYAMRCIGKGAESARMFCGIMNLPPPPTKFSKYNHILLQATRETCEHSMAEAVREAGTLLLLLMVAGRSVVFLRRMAW